MRKVFSIIAFVLSSAIAGAQVEKTDSLLRLLPSAKADTGKAMLLLEIADAYEANDQDSALFYLAESKQLSDVLQFKRGWYQYYTQSAVVSFTKGDYDAAMQQSEQALAMAIEMKDSNRVTTTLANTGIVYQYLGQFDKQLEYGLQALALLEKRNQTDKLGGMYQNVANAYYNLHQYRKSIAYSILSVRHYQLEGHNTNRTYATLGQNYGSLAMTDSALYYYTIALAESIKINDLYAAAGIYGYMTDSYADRNDFKAMLEVSEKSLALSRKLQSRQMLASSLYNVAYANYFNGNLISAERNITEALDIATQDSLMDELRNSYAVLSYIAAGQRNFKTSLWAKQKSDSIQEVILNDQLIKTTTELETKYETEKKDKQILLQQSQLEKRRNVNYLLVGSVATLLIISLLSYRNYRQTQRLQQQRIKELETLQQLTATEAVLKGEEQERTRLAKDLHDGLGGILSGIKYSFNAMKGNLIMTPENHQAFERSMDMLDSSIKEMRRVAHNLMPEALVRFGLDTALKDFCNDINQSGALHVNYQSFGLEGTTLEQTTAITVYRIIQELISNTMKHAAAKTAIVQVTKEDALMSITVEDDGRGLDPGQMKRSTGIGWTNIQHRVDFLKGKLDVNSDPGKGTSVHIEFNV